ncbi:MAG: type II 3-dehydroquinate dehydratase [Vampirovibrionales bacterium]|nr:type II 3-dehydroquinate dehydratase [Vampirovibrionales bacterium]
MTVSPAQKPIFVLQGPNLNLLGEREPHLYGTTTLAEIHDSLVAQGEAAGVAVECRQSNHEGQLIEWIQEARMASCGLIINAAALTHTSVALSDALAAYPQTIMEVHLSNLWKREAFRHHSYVSPYATGVICGLGAEGYTVAMQALIKRLKP